MSIICVTGHRPNKLYGYDLTEPRYVQLKIIFKKFLIDEKCTEAIVGMALGIDMLFALAVLELKDEGYDIKLHCAIPCKNHTSKWEGLPDSIKLYNDILSKADKIVIVTDRPYEKWMMQKRNMYMVDLSDIVLAVWDGSTGGTCNCVKYAMEKDKRVYRIRPL